MKYFTLSFLLLFLSNCSFAQTKGPDLSFKNGFFGWQFKKGEEKLKPAQVADLLKANPEASALFSSGRTSYTVSSVVGSIGGFMLGYTVGTSLGGGKANWTIGAIGAGIAVASIPLSVSATKKVRKAIALYNEGPKTGFLHRGEWRMNFTGNGLGLVYRF